MSTDFIPFWCWDWIVWENYVNTMVVDVLAPLIARSSAAMLLTVKYHVAWMRHENTSQCMVPTDLEKCLNLTFVLKSAWIFNLLWKLAVFLEKRLKITIMGLKNNDPRNIIFLCVFYAFCTFDFNKLWGFGNFVIKSPISTDPVVTTDPVIGVFHMANIVIWCMASYLMIE